MILQRPSGVSWLIAFLGNPGLPYEYTRHNAGFTAADDLARELGVRIDKSRFRSLTGTADVGDSKVLLMKPQTYMNLSGEAVAQAAQYYHIPADHIIVISDELSLPLGKIRVRPSGSAGGHNGLKNIIACLNTDQFPRIRIGVGAPPHPDYDMKDWVLSTLRGTDRETFQDAAGRAWRAALHYIEHGSADTMNKFN